MRSPAMTPAEVAAHPAFAPTCRVTCYPCATSLYVGETAPQGGGDAVFDAAGCLDDPPTCPGKDPGRYTTVTAAEVDAEPPPRPAPR